MTCWAITKDHFVEADGRPATPANAVGICGPSQCRMTAEQIINHPEAIAFRMSDSEEVLYEGFLVGDNWFAPKDDFGEPNAGCIDIEVLINDGWELL